MPRSGISRAGVFGEDAGPRVVAQAGVGDVNDKPVEVKWRLLQGDPDKVRIEPLNEKGDTVRITVQWRGPFPVREGSKLRSTRVDIGCFADNGTYHSAPAIVSVYSSGRQKREYGEGGRVLSIDYDGGKAYADPLVFWRRPWKDTYDYEGDRLLGWTREMGDRETHYTRHGLAVETRDAAGRPLQVRKVSYNVKAADKDAPPRMRPVIGEQRLHYVYEGPEDRFGKVKQGAAPTPGE